MRKAIIIVGLLALVLFVLALQLRDRDHIADFDSRPLLNEERLAILAASGQIRLLRDERVVTLVRRDGLWTVAEHDYFPAQRERLAALLHAMRGARLQEPQTANPEHHSRLGVDDSAAAGENSFRVDVSGTEGEFGIIYGNGVGTGQLIRFSGEDQVWLINRALGMSTNSADWLDLQVAELPMTFARQAKWQHADGETLLLNKGEKGDYNFRLEGLAEEQQSGNERWMNQMVLGLVSLTAQDVRPRSELELDQPMLTMTVTTWGGAELEASLHELNGRHWLLIDRFQPSEDEEILVNADPRWAFQLGPGQVEQLNKRREDIVRD
ncbi:DUF4340 domain-containing protein [Halopseudomonas salegens]|uniref:DUF4340 domain-containing protein n=1 Tax=Halopseudomonas salegens TaxID=1434072 RepID=A0A1H2ECT4_9GAMM|nr:DUF4340 domain-containing protein [Halopseudomonas salegens]SDT92921.1 protein of unknown function [Halopseudomonas salegens]